MMFWCSTVVPALKALHRRHGVRRAFVFEDTCVLAPGVFFDEVSKQTSGHSGCLFGNENYEMRDNEPYWFGSKALCITADWWLELEIVLDNTLPKDLRPLFLIDFLALVNPGFVQTNL